MNRMPTLAALLAVPLLLAGCAVGPDYHRPALPAAALAEAHAPAPAPLPDRWWQLYADADIDRLVAKALSHNADLRMAAANLQKARGLLGEARAATLPDANATASYRRQRAQYLTA
ncbi:MAG TPA: TolC family protein, partial [Novosphingobium sp.]|nr:TolC family protein [Novosphingobium sp.]